MECYRFKRIILESIYLASGGKNMPAYFLFIIFITNLLTVAPAHAATNFNTRSKETYEDFPVHEFAKSPLRDFSKLQF